MKKTSLNIITIVGLIVAFGGLGVGYYFEGGSFSALFAPSAMLIIFGGTLGATLTTMGMKEVKSVPVTLKKVFQEEAYDFHSMIDQLCEWAKIARRDGIVALGNVAEDVDDPFTRRGLEYILEGNDHEAIKELLEIEVEQMMERHHNNAKPYELAGGFAPTMGIIGAVMGLVIVLGGLGSASTEELGHGIAVAFLATLMGIGIANLLFLPFAEKLKSKSGDEVLFKSIIIEGILGIQTGQNPKTLRKKMVAYLPESMKEVSEEGRETK